MMTWGVLSLWTGMNSGDKRTYEVIGMAFVVVERLYLLDKKCLKTYIKLIFVSCKWNVDGKGKGLLEMWPWIEESSLRHVYYPIRMCCRLRLLPGSVR